MPNANRLLDVAGSVAGGMHNAHTFRTMQAAFRMRVRQTVGSELPSALLAASKGRAGRSCLYTYRFQFFRQGRYASPSESGSRGREGGWHASPPLALMHERGGRARHTSEREGSAGRVPANRSAAQLTFAPFLHLGAAASQRGRACVSPRGAVPAGRTPGLALQDTLAAAARATRAEKGERKSHTGCQQGDRDRTNGGIR